VFITLWKVMTLKIRSSPHPKPYRTLSRHTAFKSLGLGELTHVRSLFGKFKEIQWFPHTGLQVINFLNLPSEIAWNNRFCKLSTGLVAGFIKPLLKATVPPFGRAIFPFRMVFESRYSIHCYNHFLAYFCPFPYGLSVSIGLSLIRSPHFLSYY
jgi:hypothetical protein